MIEINPNSTAKPAKTTKAQELKYTRLPLEMLKLKWVSNADVIIYSFMLNRFTFFNGIHMEYFENIKQIAEGVEQGEATVKRTIKKLTEHGYIEVNKKKISVGCSNSYKVFDKHLILSAGTSPQSISKGLKKKEERDDLPW